MAQPFMPAQSGDDADTIPAADPGRGAPAPSEGFGVSGEEPDPPEASEGDPLASPDSGPLADPSHGPVTDEGPQRFRTPHPEETSP